MTAATDPRLRSLDPPTDTYERYAGSSKVAAALHSPDPSPEPAAAGTLDDPIADAFHLVDCACPDPYATPGHVEQYEPLAEMTRRTVLAEGMVVLPPVKAPVEAKVVAGAWSTLAAALVLALSTAGLQQTDTFRALLGDSPWSGPAVLAVGVVLTAAQSWAAYQAPHSPR
jgi:hypothetical protein